jgi:uncharacterized protein with PIN domain
MSDQINIRFHRELNEFLQPVQRKTNFDHDLKKARSVKDLIESIGVPHTEVELIFVNGKSVDFNYQPQDGDHISVYPTVEPLKNLPLKSSLRHCQPEPLDEPIFILDVHLGRLAAYLRMLGFDTLYRNDYDDPELADISADEHRILLTCDRKLLMRKQVSYGYFVRARQPQQQILEILTRFDLYHKLKPFSRCMFCNGLTESVNKQQIESRLLPKTKKYFDKFYQCKSCDKIYWQGSHYLKMQEMIDKIKVAADNIQQSSDQS